jgi:hypothetical protein
MSYQVRRFFPYLDWRGGARLILLVLIRFCVEEVVHTNMHSTRPLSSSEIPKRLNRHHLARLTYIGAFQGQVQQT